MRLGLDIGTNSTGWWLYETKNGEITKTINGGVRIFSDGREPSGPDKVGQPLAKKRREKRSARRMRKRYLRRRKTLIRKLEASGLWMPKDPKQPKKFEEIDPYEVRARGLKEALPLEQFGRAIFHLSQRRGFKSNRKTDSRDTNSGMIKDATDRLDRAMAASSAQTLGEFLHSRRQDDSHTRNQLRGHFPTRSVRTRLSTESRDGGNKEESGYDYYPARRHLESEFQKLWEIQANFHGSDVLSDELREDLFKTIFFQRPLKEPEVGLCSFVEYDDVPSDEKRLPKAHPLTQRRILYETVNSLRVASGGVEKRSLTLEERDLIVEALDSKKATKSPKTMQLSFANLGKKIDLEPYEHFTLETLVRDAINCDPVHASLCHPERFGQQWSELGIEDQWKVVKKIRKVESEKDQEELVEWLCETYKLSQESAEATANAPLPEGYGRLGETATRRILAELEAQVMTYSQAVKACGWHHSDFRSGEILDRLPYYGEVLSRHVIPGSGDSCDNEIKRFGRLTNPTVHVGLNQLRRLINMIISVYGKPDQIIVEVARDLKKSDEQRKKIQEDIKSNTEAAKQRSEQLRELGQPDNGYNRNLLRLWEELGPPTERRCPYSGKTISVTNLFDGSCDIDHILPYSRTLDNSRANKTLCYREANRLKKDKTPWEVWGNTDRWHFIETNLRHLPKNKSWRFGPDAMKRFEGENSFLDRALVDTQYLSRIAREYLETLYSEGRHVWVVPGKMTEMLRRHWGLNDLLADSDKDPVKVKNRSDHRHHAIDAAVIGATDRRLVQLMSDKAKREENEGFGAEQVARTTPEPWEGFRQEINNQLDKIVVSHRAERGQTENPLRGKGEDSTSGQLHNETAYGIVDESRVVSRKPFLNLKRKDIETSAKAKQELCDPYLQKLLSDKICGVGDKELPSALRDFATTKILPDGQPNPYYGIRRVRFIESLQSSARAEIKDNDGKAYKAYKCDSNYCFEIWRLPDGKLKSSVTTTFEAHGSFAYRPHAAAKLLLRLFKRDMVAIDRDEETKIYYVQKFNAKCIFLAPHTEANADARNRDKTDSFKLNSMTARPAIKANIRRVFVDEIGRIRGLRTL